MYSNMSKKDFEGNVYMVLIDNEFAGWFHIPVGTEQTYILRAALSSNPTIVDLEGLNIDLPDLPDPAQGYFWNGTSFERRQ